MQFRLASTDDGIWLWRQLRLSFVDVTCDIELGINNDVCTLGPDVDLSCGALRFGTSQLQVRTGDEGSEGDVIVRAVEYGGSGTYLGKQPRVFGTGQFRVRWPGSESYPWTEYHLSSEPIGDDISDALTYLSSVFREFRGRHTRDMRRARVRIDAAVRSNPQKKRMLDYLLEEQVIISERDSYVVDNDRMAEVGINVTDLKLRNPKPQLVAFLQEFHRR